MASNRQIVKCSTVSSTAKDCTIAAWKWYALHTTRVATVTDLAQGFKAPEAADVSEAAQVGLEVITVAGQDQTVTHGPHIGCPHILQQCTCAVLETIKHALHMYPL